MKSIAHSASASGGAPPGRPERAGPAARAGSTEPATHGDAPINILIVDDEPRNLTVLESLLDAPGYRLVRAESADQALLALVAEEFALLILDVRMPGMTGFELAQTIKGRKKTARVPIIFLTAYDNEDQQVLEGYGSGAVDYLHKPVNAAALRSKVAVFAELHRTSRELEVSNRTLLEEVTERRRAEEQLHELNKSLDRLVAERTDALLASETRYRALFHAIDEGFCVVEIEFDIASHARDFLFLECNLAFAKHMGLTATTGKRIREVLPSVEDEWLQTLGRVATSGVPLRFSGLIKALNRHVELFAFRLGGAESSRIAILMRNVTQQRRAEQTLRERERFLSTVTDAARIGLAVVEPDGLYRFANAAYARMLGLNASALAGRDVREVTSDGWSLAGPQLEQGLRGERATAEFELPGLSGDGPSRHFAAFYEPHRDAKGIRTVVVVIVEITELKLLESELREADRRKDDFIATLAHELRNPLAPVRNAVKILHLQAAETPDSNRAREVIERQVRVMARLIDDLMDVSRINQGRIELRREAVDVSQVLESAVEASRPFIDESDHRLAVVLPEEPVVVDGDPTRLSQVFVNLLTNAAKYTDRGGRIDIAAAHGEPGQVVITVTDNGIGIPPQKLASVFAMFSQVEEVISRSRGGLGIGLSLVKHIIDLHGGSVEARSAGSGHGSTFRVVLPLPVEPLNAAVTATRTAGALAVEPATDAALRILVVDDNRDGAETLSELMEMLGHQVRTAYDGEAALHAADEYRPDVMLLDIGLPLLSGYEVCRRIREQPWGGAIRVIAMTGWGDRESLRKGRDAGFDSHLVKPVDEDILIGMLSKHRPPE